MAGARGVRESTVKREAYFLDYAQAIRQRVSIPLMVTGGFRIGVSSRLVKQALEASFGNDLDTQLDLERDLQGLAGRSPDYAEGVAAFMAKRAPVFTGRPPKGADTVADTGGEA
jgi:enoyl-CoA hydratase/carnithine racemase